MSLRLCMRVIVSLIRATTPTCSASTPKEKWSCNISWTIGWRILISECCQSTPAIFKIVTSKNWQVFRYNTSRSRFTWIINILRSGRTLVPDLTKSLPRISIAITLRPRRRRRRGLLGILVMTVAGWNSDRNLKKDRRFLFRRIRMGWNHWRSWLWCQPVTFQSKCNTTDCFAPLWELLPDLTNKYMKRKSNNSNRGCKLSWATLSRMKSMAITGIKCRSNRMRFKASQSKMPPTSKWKWAWMIMITSLRKKERHNSWVWVQRGRGRCTFRRKMKAGRGKVKLKTSQISTRFWRSQAVIVAATLCQKTHRRESRNAWSKVARRPFTKMTAAALSTTFCSTQKRRLISYHSRTRICLPNCNRSRNRILKHTKVLWGITIRRIPGISWHPQRQSTAVHL